MKKSFFSLLMLAAIVLSAVSFSFSEPTVQATAPINQLAAQLPASDGVVVMDMQRLMKDALPQFLSGKVEFLNEINTHIEQIKGQVGIDLRDFEQVAVGVMLKEGAPKKVDYAPVVLARGKMNVNALIAAAKIAAKGKFREEKSGAKTIYVFAAKEIFLANKPQTMTPADDEKFNKTLARIPDEIAVTAYDDNTLAVGAPARVIETVAGKSKINPSLLALINRKTNAMMSFGANMPKDAATLFNLDANDQIGQTLNNIQQASGTMDVVGVNTAVSVVAKTYNEGQAKDLEDTLAGLQMIGKGVLAASQKAENKIYARMVDNAKISRVASEVMLDVQVANSDLTALLNK